MFPVVEDYDRAINSLESWIERFPEAEQCGGRDLSARLMEIQDEYLECGINTEPIGNILCQLAGENLLYVMRILLAHIHNPNFVLTCGKCKGLTLLQGMISIDRKDLVQLLISNTHGSRNGCVMEPLIIDDMSAKWIKTMNL